MAALRWRGLVSGAAASLVLLLQAGQLPACAGQVTWGPAPMHLSETDDLLNQQRLHDLLKRAYSQGYGARQPQRVLASAIPAEIDSFRSRVPAEPWLALAVSMVKYHFMWYAEGSSDLDVLHVADAAELMYVSILFSGCNRPDLPLEAFYQRMCSARWPYAVLMLSELGREYASRYLTEEAALALERAVAVFDEMKRLPYYAHRAHWEGPYDINFNEEWYQGVRPAGPIWDRGVVPLAQALEANLDVIVPELMGIVERGLFDQLFFESGSRAEGQDHAPEEGWRALELAAVSPLPTQDRWATPACREAPKTCALLAGEVELQGCRHSAASLVRVRAGARLKPHYGAAPQLQAQVVLQADPGVKMSVGNRTVGLGEREVLVYDGTYIRQEWHAGVHGERFVLQIAFCHPCDESQRHIYGGLVTCPTQHGQAPAAFQNPAGGGVAPATVWAPFAAAALWAATLPELVRCNDGISERCQPDTQHGGPNPLSALNTWNYALNNLKAALRYSDTPVDPSVHTAISQVQAAIQAFFAMPALEQFGAIVTSARQIFEVLTPWLKQQAPVQVSIPAPRGAQAPSAAFLPVPSSVAAADLTPLGGTKIAMPGGGSMPALGFGTWKLEGPACYNSVLWALESGIRHIDTGEAYQNEAEVGRAIADSGVPREEIFLAVKATSVAMGMAEPAHLEAIFINQLQALRTNYVDVYLLHAAGVRREQLRAVWQAMERLSDLGVAKALGVSNFGVEELEELWSMARVKPAYLQNIFKVYKPGEQILTGAGEVEGSVQWAQRHGMVVVGYSVINHWPHIMPPLEDPHVRAVAQARGRTTSQVLHRWALQHGIAVIPKASSRSRIQENARVLDFELSPAEMAWLDGLATLSESTHNELRPAWNADVFGLQGPAAATTAMRSQDAAGQSAAGGGQFEEVDRGRQCNRDVAGVRGEPFTLGGGGHDLASCQAGCAAQPDCRYVNYFHSTGYCHMYKECVGPAPVGDGAAIYARRF